MHVDSRLITQFLPRFENYGVFEAVAFGCVNTFKEPALECLQDVKQLIEKVSFSSIMQVL